MPDGTFALYVTSILRTVWRIEATP